MVKVGYRKKSDTGNIVSVIEYKAGNKDGWGIHESFTVVE